MKLLCDLQMEDLSNLCAAVRGTPIHSREQMVAPVAHKPMDAEWLNNMREKWWAKHYAGDPLDAFASKAQPRTKSSDEKITRLLNLRDHLLSLAGEQVCLPGSEPDTEKLLARGQLWPGSRLKTKKGNNNRCHENTGLLWCANPDRVVIATGYAMCDGGMWRQHSWGVQPRPRSAPWIVETTVPARAYFGVVLTLKESARFCEENIWDIQFNLPEGVEARLKALESPKKPSTSKKPR